MRDRNRAGRVEVCDDLSVPRHVAERHSSQRPCLDVSGRQARDRPQDGAESDMPHKRSHGFPGTSEKQADAEDWHGDETGQEPDSGHEYHATQPYRTQQVGANNQKRDGKADRDEHAVLHARRAAVEDSRSLADLIKKLLRDYLKGRGRT